LARSFVIVDYHLHLRRPDDSPLGPYSADRGEEYVEQARRRGIDEIGFSDHVYYFRQGEHLWEIPWMLERCSDDLDDYVGAVLEAKRCGLPVKLGLEVDYEPGREDDTRRLLEPYPWDYLLGSIHFIDGFGIDSRPRLIDEVGVEEAWRRYFETLTAAARSGLFDSLSHPDLVKIFGERIEGFDYRPVAEAIAESGTAIEVSTAGLRKPVGELYPDPGFLQACRDREVPVTVASDAHVPELVGRDFDRARDLLRSVGYETITIFEARRARQVPLG
jgi:histidinol-phosphatase (PHP family)